MSTQFVAMFLAAFYLSVAGFYASLIITRQSSTRKSPKLVHSGPYQSIHWWNHLSFRVFRAAILLVCVVRVFYPKLDLMLGVFVVPHMLVVNTIGLIALVGGFGLAIVSNLSLEKAWRSGIDHSQTRLITNGVYALSRNPSYIGVGIAQVGFFMALPSVFSLICMLVGLNALRVQVQLEEQFLSIVNPISYLEYCRKVPKWI